MIKFSDETEKKFRQIARKAGLSNNELINLLIDFWEIDDFDLLLNQLKKRCQTGMTTSDINKLSVINTFIATILKDC